MSKRRSIWRYWAKSLGEKATRDDRESDSIAIIRTCIFVSYLVTNCFIVFGVIRHWNDVPRELSQTEKERICQTTGNLSKD